MYLRFWSDGADLRTEAHKFFNVRTMHTTWKHQKDDLGNAFYLPAIFRYKKYIKAFHMNEKLGIRF